LRHLRPPFLLSILLTCPAAFAEQAQVPGVSAASFVQGLLGLVFVIGLLVFAAWMMRRLGAGGALGNPNGMRIVAGLSVGPRERILLLEVGENWVLVGVTATQMRTLHTMPKGSLPDGATQDSPQSFAGWLKHVTERKSNAG
jgi:flagellar protein FliO/FliZ